MASEGTFGPDPLDPDPEEPEPDPLEPDPDELEPPEPEPLEPDPEEPEPDPLEPDPDELDPPVPDPLEPDPDEPEPEPFEPAPDAADPDPADEAPVLTIPAEQADRQKNDRLATDQTNCEPRRFIDSLPNRPAIAPIVRGSKLAPLEIEIPSRTPRLSAQTRRSVRRSQRRQRLACGSLALVFVSVRRLTWTVPFTKPWLHNEEL